MMSMTMRGQSRCVISEKGQRDALGTKDVLLCHILRRWSYSEYRAAGLAAHRLRHHAWSLMLCSQSDFTSWTHSARSRPQAAITCAHPQILLTLVMLLEMLLAACVRVSFCRFLMSSRGAATVLLAEPALAQHPHAWPPNNGSSYDARLLDALIPGLRRRQIITEHHQHADRNPDLKP